MTEGAHTHDDRSSLVRDTLELMPLADFVSAWRAMVGEPPAVMLKSRSEMIRLLVESVPAAQSKMWIADGEAQRGTEPFS
ncbi:MAG: hypothetical protein K2Y56_23275 [Methylobacterium sp.]|uniref:hypothetical protein n=1 Tax=Methylobacterium sp. TaxID=409 RepID=UPI0025D4C3DA|nr:hypothetical protein [Methylobacterium sp.]MBX9934399.1 hypothetical protein [Methylobacterium sp.]